MNPAEDRLVELEAENAALRVQVSELPLLRAQITALLAEVQELRGQLAKHSHNSHKPPTSDGLQRRPRSQRHKSARKSGGQRGHPGQTLPLVATPDEVVRHQPMQCQHCHTALAGVTPHAVERRQVVELPPVRLQVREHQALHVRCPECGGLTVAAFPTEVPSRIQYGPRLRALVVYLVEHQLVPYARVRELLADLFGQSLSVGTLVTMVQPCAQALAPVEDALETQAQAAPVLDNDETGVRVAGRLQWVQVSSTPTLTHFGVHPKRGTEATDAIGILPAFGGVSVHDGWKPYRTYTQCRHTLCNVHHLRELTFVAEELHQPWAGKLKELLRELNAAVAAARASGLLHLPAAQRHTLQTRYEALHLAGLAANPPPPPSAVRQRGRHTQSSARNLLERLWLGQAEVLAFLDDFAISFDNNQAEQDLRMFKVQQKISGCFRAVSGAAAYCRIRGYLSTLRKRRQALLHALQAVFTGRPLLPALG
jgi:transposase